VVSGTTATASTFNTYTADVAAELTDSLSRSGKGPMTAPLKLADGTVALPALTFNSDTDTGFYWISAGIIGLAINGVKIQQWSVVGPGYVNPVGFPDGAAATPSITFASDTNTGIYWVSADTFALVANGVEVGRISSGGAQFAGGANPGLNASSTTGYGATISGNTTKAPIHIAPLAAAPSTTASGDLYIDTSSRLSVANGTTFLPAGVGVAIDRDYTPVGNVGAGEDNLQVLTLPANYLAGSFHVEYRASGTIANNANAKTLKVYFGSAAGIFSLPTGVAGDWFVTTTVYRTGASTQRYATQVLVVNGGTAAVTGYVSTGTLTETETAAITVKCTGTATSNDDIKQNTSTLLVL
jgi:hypothetical protein